MVELKAIVGNPWFKPLLILLVGLFLISSLDFASVNADHSGAAPEVSQEEIDCPGGTISDTGECEDQEPPSEQTLLQRVWIFIRDLILPIIEGII